MRRILTALRRQLAALRPRRLAPAPVPVRRPVSRRGLTLVEMLVTLAITLIMMAAVVNVFASIGQSVEFRRASIEVSNQVRIARTLLAQDLSRATATTLPPRDPSSGEGYIEIIEGIHTDWFPTSLAGGPNPPATSLVPRGRSASVDEDALTSAQRLKLFPMQDSDVSDQLESLGLSALGDYDDVLALTVRSDGEPFVGRFGTQTIKSHEAEIVWFAVENPVPSPSDPLRIDLGEPGMRTVYRRILLVAPWLENPTNCDGEIKSTLACEINNLNVRLNDKGLPPLPEGDDGSPEALRRFYRYFDISVRRDPQTNRWVANSLSDLTKRENRFAHLAAFPHAMNVSRIRFASGSAELLRSPLVVFGAMEFGSPTNLEAAESTDELIRVGEDVVLTNVLGFDLRVFDPQAPLLNVKGTVVEPSDVGWHVKDNQDIWQANWLPSANNIQNVVGRGAYVDLAYMGDPTRPLYEDSSQVLPTSGGPISAFSRRGQPRSGAGVSENLIRSFYDTWSFHYEYDGLNQDHMDATHLVKALRDDFTDEGTNGVDDDSANGVDDLSERETLPPYLTSLRGMEVKLRVYEPDSRIIREVSVKENFTPQ